MNLPLFITINPSLCYSYNNALHTNFQSEMYKAVSKSPAVGFIKVKAETFQEWKRLIDLEVEINRYISAQQETVKLGDTDVLRDSYVTYTFQTVRNELLSPIPAKKEAAEALILIVNKYNGLQGEAVDVESEHIIGLLATLKEEKNQAYCATLGLTEIVALLETTNNEYISLKEQRTEVRTDTTLPSSKETRPLTDKVLESVCDFVKASHLLSEVPEEKQAIEALVAKMNQIIAESKTTYNQMQAQAKAKGDTPTPPKEGL